MKMLRSLILLVALSTVAAACGLTTKSPGPTFFAASMAPSPSPELAALTLRLVKCPVTTGCGAYGSVTRLGGAAGEEVLLEGFGEPHARGLPERLELGSYVVRVRFFTISDEVANGQVQELPFGPPCETLVRVMGNNAGEQIDLVVAFADGACVITQSSRIAQT